MKTTTHCIVLLSAVSLWSGCMDQQPQTDAPKLLPKPSAALVAEKTPEPVFKPAPTETLTATAPLPPKSVADGVAVPAGAAVTSETQAATTSDKAALKGEKLAPAMFEHESADFDRTVAASEVKVERFVFATDVQGREPVGEQDSFRSDTKKIFAFVQLANAGEPYAVVVHWEAVGGPNNPYGVKLTVPTSARYRTWSWTALQHKPGRYRAVLRTLDGEEIASRELEITAAAGED